MNYDNLIYFLNGSVGDFLMALFFMENARHNEQPPRLFIVTPRNKQIFQELAEAYPYVTLLEANKRSISGIITLISLGRFIFSRNIVATPPTPGILPMFTKVIGRITALHRASCLVGFDDGEPINRVYTKLLPYDTTIPYVETIKTLLQELGFQITQPAPILSFTEDRAILQKLGCVSNSYVVFHPRGSDKKRSVTYDDILFIVRELRKRFSEYTIILSGSREDRAHLKHALEGYQDEGVLNAGGEISMSELATLLAHARLYVGVDTGISHLAAFVGTQSVVFSHIATVSNWLPYYSSGTRVLYHIRGDAESHDDIAYLKEHCWGRHCLTMPGRDAILAKVTETLS